MILALNTHLLDQGFVGAAAVDSGGACSEISDHGLCTLWYGCPVCSSLKRGDLLLQGGSVLRHGFVLYSWGGQNVGCFCYGALAEGVVTGVPAPLGFIFFRLRDNAVLLRKNLFVCPSRLAGRCLPLFQ